METVSPAIYSRSVSVDTCFGRNSKTSSSLVTSQINRIMFAISAHRDKSTLKSGAAVDVSTKRGKAYRFLGSVSTLGFN